MNQILHSIIMKRRKRKQKTKQGISAARTLAYRWIREKIIKILEGSGFEWSGNFNKYEHIPDFENTSREDRNPNFFPDQTKPFKKKKTNLNIFVLRTISNLNIILLI